MFPRNGFGAAKVNGKPKKRRKKLLKVEYYTCPIIDKTNPGSRQKII